MNIYVVIGSCGEYSDRRKWIVCWYPTKEEADAHAAAAAAESAAIAPRHRYSGQYGAGAMPHDPYWQTDYTGTEYHVEMVERGGGS